jgi:hypothetical protein
MQGATPSDCQAIAVRIQRLLGETLDRHAGGSEADRARALGDTLRAELSALPAVERGPVLAALRILHPDDAPPGTRSPTAPSAREIEIEVEAGELRAEVERLRAALAAPAAPPPSAGSPGEVERTLVTTLAGSGADVEALLADPALPARLAAVARALVEFAERLGRVFLGATTDADRTMAGRVRGLASDAVRGRVAPEMLDDELERVSRRIGGQLLAFREACEAGARDLLRQIAPAAIEAEANRAASGVGRRFFFYKDCWELLLQRHEALRASDELFEVYFNGAYQSALLRQSQGGEAAGGGGPA